MVGGENTENIESKLNISKSTFSPKIWQNANMSREGDEIANNNFRNYGNFYQNKIKLLEFRGQ